MGLRGVTGSKTWIPDACRRKRCARTSLRFSAYSSMKMTRTIVCVASKSAAIGAKVSYYRIRVAHFLRIVFSWKKKKEKSISVDYWWDNNFFDNCSDNQLQFSDECRLIRKRREKEKNGLEWRQVSWAGDKNHGRKLSISPRNCAHHGSIKNRWVIVISVVFQWWKKKYRAEKEKSSFRGLCYLESLFVSLSVRTIVECALIFVQGSNATEIPINPRLIVNYQWFLFND